MEWKPGGWLAGGGRGHRTLTKPDGAPEGWEAESLEDSSSLLSWCPESGQEKGFPTSPPSFITLGPVFNVISALCLIFTAERKKTKKKKQLLCGWKNMGKLASSGCWRPVSDSHWKRQPLGGLFSHHLA